MLRAIDKWIGGYLRSVNRRPRHVTDLKHLFFCVADHFEPCRDNVDAGTARRLVRDWTDAYRKSVAGVRDADGRCPRHTFFYPAEDYDPEIIESLAGLCRSGHGEVEIHLHHRDDTVAGLRMKLLAFRDKLNGQHGLLGRDATGRIRYGFVHGNWALCNARPDGDWCGVNAELGILSDTGCYADFTFPSAPSPTQPQMVNCIYRARDKADRPRGADSGVPVEVGRGGGQEGFRVQGSGEPRRSAAVLRTEEGGGRQSGACGGVSGDDGSLMIIQGPLALNWCRRKWGVLPRLENAEISGANPPSADRIRLWTRQWIHVVGRPEWVFVKVHTHGCVAANSAVILGDRMRQAHEALDRAFNDGNEWRLHYVTAREMCNLVLSAEAGAKGEPKDFLDAVVRPPAVAGPQGNG